MSSYYLNKQNYLRRIFGRDDISITESHCIVGGRAYPIVDDVIVLLDENQYPPALKARLGVATHGQTGGQAFAEDIQFTFGEEWQRFPDILPEHRKEFEQYFDLVDLSSLGDSLAFDLGCGIGRWSHFIKNHCGQIALVDFSEAIFVARKNLSESDNALFFMGDIKQLPFAPDCADFIFCLGVLHHLPSPALSEIRALARFASKILVYLYYALDNRPAHYRIIFQVATVIRQAVCRIRSQAFRRFFTWMVAVFAYKPLALFGSALAPLGLQSHVPLYDFYHGKSMERIRQDVYDRFFTRIEQRFSREQIRGLEDSFSSVTISENIPYWHFLCQR
ncbi:MAG: class I SAM-dependent methyltransferase [Nitrospinae bacterium]|nr:class I SAM-dependent methyltransferase [Nitrospinota bacterium]MBF0633249.1 class I SAM-dependent methyltransferase [Nitrospinota bacterium]